MREINGTITLDYLPQFEGKAEISFRAWGTVRDGQASVGEPDRMNEINLAVTRCEINVLYAMVTLDLSKMDAATREVLNQFVKERVGEDVLADRLFESNEIP